MTQFVSTWGPTITLAIGVLAFVWTRTKEITDLRRERRQENERKQRELEMKQSLLDNEWLQAAIHEAFHKKANGQLTLDEIRQNLANSAFWDAEAVKITKDKLTDQLLRKLIVSMVEKGVIEQVLSDHYSLKFKQTTIAETTINQNTEALQPLEDIVREYPGLELDKIRNMLLEKTGINLGRVQCNSILYQLEGLQLITLRDQKWWPI